MEATNIGEYCITVRHDADDLALRRQQLLQTGRYDAMIVRN